MKSPIVESGQSMLDAANNIPEPKKHMLIAYHANCLDGFTAAWAVVKNLPEGMDYELEPMEYTQNSYDLLAMSAEDWYVTHIAIVDFSIPLNTIAKLNAISHLQEITILDHHKTAFQTYGYEGEITADITMRLDIGKTLILLDNSRSGAALAWQWLYADNPSTGSVYEEIILPNLVKYVQDYDLWKFEYPETKAINAYLKLTPRCIAAWDGIHLDLEDPHYRELIIAEGSELLEVFERECRRLAAKADPITFIVSEADIIYSSLYAYCTPGYSSRVGEILAERTGTFGVTYCMAPNGKAKVSLRSSSDVDVSTLARYFGGGGHAKAAGFEIDLEKLLDPTGVRP